jgi:pyrroloquinoline quinone biosynthesis protein B
VIDDGDAWLLDAGPDFRQHLVRLENAGAELVGILLTHGHIGHYTGLMYLGREAMNVAGLPVWAAPRLAEYLTGNGPWEQLVTSGNIDLRVIDTAAVIPLSPRVRAKAFTVPHRDEYSETVGIQVNGPGAGVLYLPDTDGWEDWDRPIEDHIGDVDIALLDATFFDGDELLAGNMAGIVHPLVVDSLARFNVLSDNERAKVRFTHLNHSNPLLDRNSDAFIRVARAGMGVAAEGDVYIL